MRHLLVLILVLCAGIFTGCVGSPATDQPFRPAMIVLLRHGEKPLPPEPEGINLSAKGRERAQALVNVFKTRPELNVNGKPVVIYAMGPGGNDGSHRPMQTIEPTSKALGIPMISRYTHEEYPDVARQIFANPSYQGRTVIICWEHHVIPEFAKSLGVHHPPAKWHGDVFDIFWIITYPDGKAVLTQLPERALPGDTQ